MGDALSSSKRPGIALQIHFRTNKKKLNRSARNTNTILFRHNRRNTLFLFLHQDIHDIDCNIEKMKL